MESARLIAGLARIVRDVGLAEELAQDALVAALRQWPESGVPDNPGAWLMGTAKHRAIDELRRSRRRELKHEEIGRDLEALQERAAADLDSAIDAIDDDVGDDLLRLLFTACHPVLSTEARLALTLRLLGGLTTEEIARAFLVPEPTLAQRLVRAKKKIREAGIAYEVPGPDRLAARLDSVLRVLYLVFNEGYTASSGEALIRQELCAEAIRMARIVAGLLPDEAEALGLLALMLLTDARRPARVGPGGELVRLEDQDRARWDTARIAEGRVLVERALRVGRVGPYQLQAAIAAVHDEAPTAADTDWPQILGLYEVLLRVAPSPVVALNRAVAVAQVRGPGAGLAAVDALAGDPAMEGYRFFHAARADLLRRLGRTAEAVVAYDRALALGPNDPERAFLEARRAEAIGRAAAG